MATKTDLESRMSAQNMSKRDFYAGISLITLHIGAQFGFTAALFRSTYHIVKRTPNRPGFLHTTGWWAMGFGLWAATIPLRLYISGAPSAFDMFNQHSGATANTEDDRHKLEETARALKKLRTFYTWAGVSVLSGAGFVAIRYGFRRGNFPSTVGGACAGLELYRVMDPWHVLEERTTKADNKFCFVPYATTDLVAPVAALGRHGQDATILPRLSTSWDCGEADHTANTGRDSERSPWLRDIPGFWITGSTKWRRAYSSPF